ncbi:hypothetical protein [Microbacterium rhizosphaerae]|jgi:hypothetical protein|uniref:Uncharacterized protein n=1 Tax=Microbacterium rhizosphaerae TaxID=1678237 RepID=A0ABZ0SIP9_9MICO|nr:hypothetical protein [Microbacterium rhizosphaerae]WPR88453.1 hypothetical protein SM116_11770 [Microbacterium rhizosphaerae]
MTRGWGAALAIAVALAAVTGCSAVGAPHPSPSSSVSASVPSPRASTATPEPVDGVVSVDESENGMTVTVHTGDRIVATLHNTYWQFAAPTGVLRPRGDAVTTPDPKGSCLPGVGCGTVRLTALAASAGEGALTASRTSCGEAMGCAPGQGSWSIHVVVR